MKILIDGRMLYWTGVGRYIKALLDELASIDTTNQYAVLVRRKDWALWEPTTPNFEKIECNINPYSLGEQLTLPGKIKTLHPDLVHFTVPNTPLFYGGLKVINVHDLTLLDFDTSRGRGVAKFLRGLKRIPFRLVLRNDIHSATRIITVTQYVADQIQARFDTSKDRLATTLLAVDPAVAQPAPLDRFGELGRYVFYVGNVYPYKNVASTLRALAMLRETHKDLSFVIAGKPDAFTDELKALAAELGLAERVKFVGFISDGEMISLYRGAAAYVNPSLNEGFGLQGLEAMAQNVPVVAARASCLPEVYGEAAEYFDPNNPADQARALSRVIDDPKRAAELKAAGAERIKQFSWRRMAEQTLTIYEEAIK